MRYLFSHAHLIVDGNKELIDAALLVDGDRIVDVLYQNKIDKEDKNYEVIDLHGQIVMPGFFDSHIYGFNNVNFDSAIKNDLDDLSFKLSKEGTTTYLAGLSSALNKNDFLKQASVLKEYENKYGHYLGTYAQGFLLNPDYVREDNRNNLGNINADFIDDLKELNIKQMCIAPEMINSKKWIEKIKRNNIKIMAGYSAAEEKDLNEDFDGICHLCVKMKPMHHKQTSLVNAAFTNKYYCELIADEEIINKEFIKLIIKNIDRHKLILVSNSCKEKENTIINGMKLLRSIGVDYTDLLLYSSLNAHELYGTNKQYGSLLKGKYADIVIMDEELNIKNVYTRGRFVYE